MRDQDQDDRHKRSSLPSLRAFDSLSIHDSCYPVKDYEDDTPSPILRIPKTCVPKIAMPIISISKGEEKNIKEIDEEDDRLNIRASPIPRPRAVLSSPDNDGVIGSKNKAKAEGPSPLRNHNLVQNRQRQCKVNSRPGVVTESPISSGRKPKEVTDNKSDLKGKKGSAIAVPSQRTQLRRGKPSSERI